MPMIILTFLVLFLDIMSKVIVRHYLYLNDSIEVIRDFLRITYVRNTGAAWSIFDNNTLLVSIISGCIILGIIMYVNKNKPVNKLERTSYAFILGGAMGNFLNRVVDGYVIDFIDVQIFSYNYPIFNLADVFIVLGVFFLVIYTLKGEKWNLG